MDIVSLVIHTSGMLMLLMLTLGLILAFLVLTWLPFEAEFPQEAERLKNLIRKRINRWIDRIES